MAKSRPLAVVHLALDRAHGREARRAQQVEHAGRRTPPTGHDRLAGFVKALGDRRERFALISSLPTCRRPPRCPWRRPRPLRRSRRTARRRCADHFFLRHQTHHRGHGGLPVAKAQRLGTRAPPRRRSGPGCTHRSSPPRRTPTEVPSASAMAAVPPPPFRVSCQHRSVSAAAVSRRSRFLPPARAPSRSWK